MTDMEKVREEERQRLTLEALADVDAGNVINHQAVQAWANSLNTEAPLIKMVMGHFLYCKRHKNAYFVGARS